MNWPVEPRPEVLHPHRSPWWRIAQDPRDEEEQLARATSLITCARDLENTQREVHEQNLWNAQLYSNREMAAFDWGTGILARASLSPVSRLGENLVLTVVDTHVSLVGKNRPKATPIPRGASWKIRRQAKRLDKFLYGEFLRNRVYVTGKRVFRDACIFGFGGVHVTVEDSESGPRTCVEKVFPDEILVDQAECVATGRFRHVYRRRVLPVEVVAETYGVDEDELAAVSAKSTDYLDYRPVGRGWVVLVEGWQLGGRHVVAVNGLPPLEDEPWPHDWFPLVFFHFQDPVNGFYWPGAVELSVNDQVRLNEINEVIRDAQDLMARPRILVAEGSGISPGEFDNLVGRIIKYTGIKPEPTTWPAVSAELYSERDRIWTTGLAKHGLNQTSTSAAPPPNARFDSSAAFREFNAMQDGRLADLAQRFEQFYLDVAEMQIRVIRASGKNPVTTWFSGGRRARSERINWADIDLDESAYVLQLEASSIFNLTPSALRDELETQLAKGLITPEEYRMLVASPDLESEASIQAAAAEDLGGVIEDLEDGKKPRPVPAQDLVNGVRRVTYAYLQAKRYPDVDPEVLANFLDWLAAARGWLEKGADQSPTPAPPVLPQVVPGAPPASPGIAAPMMPGIPGPVI